MSETKSNFGIAKRTSENFFLFIGRIHRKGLTDTYCVWRTYSHTHTHIQSDSYGDTFDEVIVEELRLMRKAFETKLKGANEEVERIRTDHMQTLRSVCIFYLGASLNTPHTHAGP